MKIVQDNKRQVAHLWAHRSQPEARAGNLFFENNTIYSYGRHFPIARWVQRKGKGWAVLMTTRTYSVTTSQHISEVWRALPPNTTVFRVLDVEARVRREHIENIETIKAEIVARVQKIARARAHKDYLIQDLQTLITNANAYSQYFGLRVKLGLPKDFDIAAAKKMAAEYNAKREKEEAAKEKKREERRKVLHAEWMLMMRRWQKGEDVGYIGSGYDQLAYLRIHENRVQTTQGAEIPVAAAERLWKFLCRIEPIAPFGQLCYPEVKVGPFQGMDVGRDCLRIGCHRIPWDEVTRLAKELGLEGELKIAKEPDNGATVLADAVSTESVQGLVSEPPASGSGHDPQEADQQAVSN